MDPSGKKKRMEPKCDRQSKEKVRINKCIASQMTPNRGWTREQLGWFQQANLVLRRDKNIDARFQPYLSTARN